MFLTNNSPDVYVLTLYIKIRQNNLYLASLPRIATNLNKNYRCYNFQALTNISGNFLVNIVSQFQSSTFGHNQPTLQRGLSAIAELLA